MMTKAWPPRMSPDSWSLAARWAARAEIPLMAVEAWVGAIFTTLLCLLLGIPVMLAAVTAPFTGEMGPGWCILLVLLGLLWIRFDAPHLYRTWSCVRRGDRPLAPAVAQCQPPVGLVLRPVATMWMLGHFVFGVSFALMTEGPSSSGQGESRHLAHMLFVTAITLAYTFAANGFLLSTVKALTGSDVWVRRVWSCRVLIDLGVVALSILPLGVSRNGG